MSDTHWGAKDGIAMTRSAVALINRLPVKVEFVAITGDLFADSIRNQEVVPESVDVLKGLKVPVYCVPGNHDIRQEDFNGDKLIFQKYFGPIEQKVTVEGVVCLFLCSEMQRDEPRSAWQTERAVIGEMIGASKDPVLIFMHRPPLRDLLGNEGKAAEQWGEVSDPAWARFLSKHPSVKGVFAGHFHRDETIWIGDVPVFVAPAVARFWDRQPSFRLYEYKDGHINYWTLYPERPRG
jgi:Icc-related predicted phosphoesterase